MTKHCTVVVPASFAVLLALLAPAVVTRADIFQWEYINPADPNQGKQLSMTLAPDGAGVNAARGMNLSHLDLTKAYLIGADLGPEILSYDEYGFPMDYVRSDLTNVILRQADVSFASFLGATLTGADLTGAEVRRTFFGSFNGSFNFGGTGITAAQLYSTASYQARDLTGIGLAGNNSLAGVDLVGQNLTGAYIVESMPQANLSQANLRFAAFDSADLTGANLSGAEVRNASFRHTGLTTAQLYSTASYQAHDLTGIALIGNFLLGVNLNAINLTGADFRGTNLAGANLAHANLIKANFSGNYFYYGGADLSGANLSHANLTNASFAGDFNSPGANLTGANLTAADARGANFYRPRMDGAITTNLIQPDGHIDGLDLTSGASLVVRDYDGNPGPIPNGPLPIVVEEHFTMDATGALQLMFEEDAWDSTVSFAPGISVALGGTMELTFAPGVNVATQSGRTIDIFDWTGVTPSGAFTVSSAYAWDISKLYTTGEVTLTAIPTLPGDFNSDGTVDATDYVVWRKNDGTQSGYNIWRSHFGQTAVNGAALPSAEPLSAATPEPATLVVLFVGALAMCTRRGREAP